jgi:hypothetical protein
VVHGCDNIGLCLLTQQVYVVTHLVFMCCDYGMQQPSAKDAYLMSKRYGVFLGKAAARFVHLVGLRIATVC